jgi:mannose-1-phosphate guanylyltransferase/mannose-1-phosphate guanylyltransferase/mannose-6-phosphate isomerase
MSRIHPVIMSGGSGTRLWPLSRTSRPKQFLELGGQVSLFRQAARRVSNEDLFDRLTVICAEPHRFLAAEDLRQEGRNARIILEPVGRNTAAAAAVSALAAMERDREALILLMPADHVINDRDRFEAAVRTARKAVSKGYLTLFGVVPTSAATGYGYIQRGEVLDNIDGVHAVRAFKEKPDSMTANAYLESGEYFWNSGIFLMGASVFLSELERFEPRIVEACRAAWAYAAHEEDFVRLPEADFASSPSISIDYAVMERTTKAAVVPAGFQWSDVGSYSALWEAAAKDEAGNVCGSRDLLIDAKDCYLHSEAQMIAALGVEGLVVVATDDAILVARRERDQDVKRFAEMAKAARSQGTSPP